MAILNRIVNILILLLVITAGVFSFMLFAKRAQLTDGMKQMADAINKAAKTMDDGSGTKSASALTAEALSHTKYSEFPETLKKLDEQTKKIMKQRNDLAKSLKAVADALGFSGFTKEKFQHMDNYENEGKKLLAASKGLKQHQGRINAAFASVGGKLGASVSAVEFASGTGYGAAVKKIEGRITAINKERNTMRGDLTAASRTIGHGKYDHVRSSAFRASLKKHDDLFKKNKNDLAVARRTIKSHEGTIKKRDGTIKSHEDKIKKLEKDINDYHNQLTDNGKKPLPGVRLSPGSPKCYELVRAKISYVSKEYGFVQLDIGKSYVIVQEYGARKNRVSFPLQAGLTMTVARGQKEIGKILVKTVNDNNSICNIVEGNVEDFKEGDDVFFSEEDRKGIPAVR